jgi:hypothetical protein
MSATIKLDKLVFLNEAEKILKKRYPSIVNKEIDRFLLDNIFDRPRYDCTGKPSVGGGCFEREDIEIFDFYDRTNPQVGRWYENGRIVERTFCALTPIIKRILRSSIEGEIISGLEAAIMLRDKEYDNVNVRVILNAHVLQAFKNKDPDENGRIIVNTDILEDYENLFYSQLAISMFISPVELQFITLESIKAREPWNKLTNLEIITLLKKKTHQKKLKIYDENCFCPSREENERIGQKGDGSPIILSTRIVTDFYGEEALSLINNEKAMFQLSEIIAIEESHFSKEKKKVSLRKHNLVITKELFNKLSSAINNGTEVPILNKDDLACKILKMGNVGQLYKKTISKSTVYKYLSDSGINKEQWEPLTESKWL